MWVTSTSQSPPLMAWPKRVPTQTSPPTPFSSSPASGPGISNSAKSFTPAWLNPNSSPTRSFSTLSSACTQSVGIGLKRKPYFIVWEIRETWFLGVLWFCVLQIMIWNLKPLGHSLKCLRMVFTQMSIASRLSFGHV
ncbi:hypothetical protein FH972_016393 [Carpinus fangiana]|uniref:Uncharacterized protein n=1 Tax=Carpinus fangiana TaxID=176857 RepID=A0A5N6RFT3_9ROSI|nr:hypothetical protein FH972_016393 [Carpinus fangiana]